MYTPVHAVLTIDPLTQYTARVNDWLESANGGSKQRPCFNFGLLNPFFYSYMIF